MTSADPNSRALAGHVRACPAGRRVAKEVGLISVVEDRVPPTHGVANSSRVRRYTDRKTMEGNAALNEVKASEAAKGFPSAEVVAEKRAQKPLGKANT